MPVLDEIEGLSDTDRARIRAAVDEAPEPSEDQLSRLRPLLAGAWEEARSA